MSLFKRGKAIGLRSGSMACARCPRLDSNRRQSGSPSSSTASKDELIARQFQLPRVQPVDDLRRTLRPLPGRRRCKALPPRPRQSIFLPFFGEMEIGRITRNDVIRYRKLPPRGVSARAEEDTGPKAHRHHHQPGHRGHPPGCSSGRSTKGSSSTTRSPASAWCGSGGRRRPVMPVAEEVEAASLPAPTSRPIVIAGARYRDATG